MLGGERQGRTMQYRTFGKTGLEVSEIGLGTSKRLVEKATVEEGERLVRRALDLGINFIDTALHYGKGEAEVRVGNAIKGRRDEVFLASKCGTIPANKYSWAGSSGFPRDFSPRSMRLSLDASLRELQTDYVDIYQLHMASGSILAEGSDAVATLLELKDEGKTRFIGASVDGEDMHRALRLGVFDTLQVTYNIADMFPEESGFFEAAAEQSIGLVIKEPLAVAQYYRPAPTPPWVAYLWERVRTYDFLKENDENLSPPEICLRFVLSHPGIHTAIQATSSIEHLEANAGLSDGRGLSAKMMETVRAAYRQAAG
jgi:aryl-alcohol dehydrogenase-like predicted oxidoreductase